MKLSFPLGDTDRQAIGRYDESSHITHSLKKGGFVRGGDRNQTLRGPVSPHAQCSLTRQALPSTIVAQREVARTYPPRPPGLSPPPDSIRPAFEPMETPNRAENPVARRAWVWYQWNRIGMLSEPVGPRFRMGALSSCRQGSNTMAFESLGGPDAQCSATSIAGQQRWVRKLLASRPGYTHDSQTAGFPQEGGKGRHFDT